MKGKLEWVLMPYVDEIFLHYQSRINLELLEDSCVLFYSQFWKEEDNVWSLSSELLGETETIIAVEFDQRSVFLLQDNQIHHCLLLDNAIFSLLETTYKSSLVLTVILLAWSLQFYKVDLFSVCQLICLMRWVLSIV